MRRLIPFLAIVIVLAGVGMFAPSQIPRPLRDLIGLGPDRLRPAVHGDDIGRYSFLAHQPGDPRSPVGYDPCRVVEVRINPQGAAPGQVDLVRSALDDVSDLTGLQLRYTGETGARPRWGPNRVPVVLGEPRRSPILIAWADESEVAELRGDVAGVGGSLPLPVGDRVRYVTGGVTLDAEVFGRLHGEQRDDSARAIVLHELGHLVGLGHVHDPGELMNEENLGLLDFGPGDRAGLARVGSTPCA